MKRIHLFEFEDLKWFPNWLRRSLTRLIVVMHRILGTSDELVQLLSKLANKTGKQTIVDLCSGSGGPMPEVFKKLNEQDKIENLILTDLFPDQAPKSLRSSKIEGLEYKTEPVDAASSDIPKGIRTLVGSFHHFRPDLARKILESAASSKEPICIFEISDNSMPKMLWWIAIPTNLLVCLFVTPMVRPFTWYQFLFTYLIPIIPIFFAWDGAVSNSRTYTLDDLDMLLEGIPTEGYTWEKGKLKGKGTRIYLMGYPTK